MLHLMTRGTHHHSLSCGLQIEEPWDLLLFYHILRKTSPHTQTRKYSNNATDLTWEVRRLGGGDTVFPTSSLSYWHQQEVEALSCQGHHIHCQMKQNGFKWKVFCSCALFL